MTRLLCKYRKTRFGLTKGARAGLNHLRLRKLPNPNIIMSLSLTNGLVLLILWKIRDNVPMSKPFREMNQNSCLNLLKSMVPG